MHAEERIEIRLPSNLAVVSGINSEGDWICSVEAVATNVETGETSTFGNTVSGGFERSTREEMAAQLAKWFHHEMLEQLGCKPGHYDGPDEDD
jgi:hypothetical protein